ncbi:MAG: mevalonate kinase [Planctomycetota bacterium]
MTDARAIPGKLFLAGEYAVLHGGPAAVLAVNRTLRATVVEVRDGDTGRIDVPQWGLRLESPGEPPSEHDKVDPRERFIRRLVGAAIALAGVPWRAVLSAGAHDHDLLGRDLGLGTSAALSVAIARALLHHEPPDSPAVLDLALDAHQAVQGARSSGADVAAAWAGCSIRYQRTGSAQPLAEPLRVPADGAPWPFAALFSGTSVRTGTAVQSFDQASASDPAGCDRCLAAVNGATEAVLAARDLQALLVSVDAAADALAGMADWMGAPPPVPVPLRDAIRGAGAVIKSSGAVGGDCAVILARDLAALDAACNLAAAAGFEPLRDVQPLFDTG